MRPVEGKSHLVKSSNGAVVNVDEDAFRIAKLTKKRILDAKRREEELENRVARLENAIEKLLKDKENG